jgi:hypothetical protein
VHLSALISAAENAAKKIAASPPRHTGKESRMSSSAVYGRAGAEGRSAGVSAATVSPDSPTRAATPARRRILRLLMVVAAIAAVVYVLDEFVKYRLIAKRFGTVYSGELYRSGQISRWMFEKTIRANGIQVVIDLNGIEPTDEHQAAEIASAEKLNLELHRFQLAGDGRGDIRRYADAIAVIHQSRLVGKPTLVHCSAGTQRTGGVVATYRMLVRGESPSKAWDEMVQYGWRPAREQELLDYINGNMRELAGLLVERGVIARIPDPLPRLAR